MSLRVFDRKQKIFLTLLVSDFQKNTLPRHAYSGRHHGPISYDALKLLLLSIIAAREGQMFLT